MTEEVNVTNEKKECNCICQSESFRKFLVVAAGTFVGVYCAMSLFFAIHKPPVPVFPPQGAFHRCPCVMMHHAKRFDRPDKPHFDKKLPKEFDQRAPFEVQK